MGIHVPRKSRRRGILFSGIEAMDAMIDSGAETLRTLPGDDVCQIMWRFADRYDLQMLVQSVRAVACGPVARLVAEGGRNSHEWTPGKNDLLQMFDESGINLQAEFLRSGTFTIQNDAQDSPPTP
jgi:hypothetical protein